MDKEFDFKAVDAEGEETLKAIAAANKFNTWMFDTIKPYCKGKVLEVGSGIGNISKLCLASNFRLTISDLRENYCKVLEDSFGTNPNCEGIINLDLVAPDFDDKYKHLLASFDTIFALNVVEHIFDDKQALRNCNKLLKTGGHVIILVPAYQVLFNRFDKELEHYRRYNAALLDSVISPSFKVIHSQYFNFMGIFGWFLSGKIMNKKTIPSGQMKLYNYLVPIFKIIDKIMFNKVGLSVVQVGVKEKNF